jgi:hypothetical protein
MINDSDKILIVDDFHEIFIVLFGHSDNSWQLEELRSSAKFARLSRTINTHMQIAPITTQSITTTSSVQNNRIETVRAEYVDLGGRVEVRETYYYYMIYDSKAKIQEPAANQIDLRV